MVLSFVCSATSCSIQCLVCALSFTDKIEFSHLFIKRTRALYTVDSVIISKLILSRFLSIKRAFRHFFRCCSNRELWIAQLFFGTFVLLLVCRVDLAEASLIYVIQSLGRARACSALFTLIIITRILPSPILNIQHCQIFDCEPYRHSLVCVCARWKLKERDAFFSLDASLPFPMIQKTVKSLIHSI